jgi:Bacterial Ig-like domain (group 3)/FG-GAP repeat
VDTGIFFGNGDGTVQSFNAGNDFVEPAQTINFSGGGQAAPTDINGDGKPDLILGSVVLINNGISTSSLTPTTTALAASATSITAGQSVTFTATVSASPTPSGTVAFYDGTTTLGEGTLNSSGVATYATTALSAGSHSITAAYRGNSTFAASASAATTVTVTAATLNATATTLTASASSIGAGGSVTFSATVTPGSGTWTPTGTVTFMNGTTALGTGTLSGGAASYSTSSLATGANPITAVYSGDSNFSSSTSTAVVVTVTAVTPSFTIADSPASGTVTAGQSAQTTITVTPTGGFSQQVNFACTGLPTGATCSFSPENVTPSGSAAKTTLTIATTAQSAALARPDDSRLHLRHRIRAALVVLAGGFFWFFRGRRRLSYWTGPQLGLMFLLTAAAAILGCGGSSSSSGSGGTTQPQTYSVTVTATAGSESQTTTFSLAVQ